MTLWQVCRRRHMALQLVWHSDICFGIAFLETSASGMGIERTGNNQIELLKRFVGSDLHEMRKKRISLLFACERFLWDKISTYLILKGWEMKSIQIQYHLSTCLVDFVLLQDGGCALTALHAANWPFFSQNYPYAPFVFSHHFPERLGYYHANLLFDSVLFSDSEFFHMNLCQYLVILPIVQRLFLMATPTTLWIATLFAIAATCSLNF